MPVRLERSRYAAHMQAGPPSAERVRRKLFISYSRVDKWVGRIYVEPLNQIAGVKLFWDEEIHPGEQFSSRITEQLSKADEFLVVLSPSSVHRPWVIAEIGMALLRGIPIVPILHSYTIEESLRSPAGAFLTQWQHIDGPDDFDKYLVELREKCATEGIDPA